MEEIAERAGYSRGAFYSNFEGKEDAFLALLDHHIEAELALMREAVAADPSPRGFSAYLQRRPERRAAGAKQWVLLSIEFWLHVVRHPELAPKLAARQSVARETLARVIEAQCTQFGVTLPSPAEEMASVMMAVDDGLIFQEYLDPTAVPEDLRIRSMLLFARWLGALATPRRRED